MKIYSQKFISLFLLILILMLIQHEGTSFAEMVNEVHIICDSTEDTLLIVYNDSVPSDKISRQAIIKSYNLYDYVIYKNDYLQAIKKIKYNCKLESKIYSVYIEPYLYNNNPMGECGADITCSVTVKEKDKVIVQEKYLELSCPPGSSFKIKKISVSGKDGKVDIEKIPEAVVNEVSPINKKQVVKPKKAN